MWQSLALLCLAVLPGPGRSVSHQNRSLYKYIMYDGDAVDYGEAANGSDVGYYDEKVDVEYGQGEARRVYGAEVFFCQLQGSRQHVSQAVELKLY